MTINYTPEWFMHTLSETASLIEWEVNEHNQIRGRKWDSTTKTHLLFCPVTAVTWRWNNQHFGISQVVAAALTLDINFWMDLVFDADGLIPCRSGYRARMIEALGLTERINR